MRNELSQSPAQTLEAALLPLKNLESTLRDSLEPVIESFRGQLAETSTLLKEQFSLLEKAVAAVEDSVLTLRQPTEKLADVVSEIKGQFGEVRQLNLDSQEPGQLTFSSLVVLSGVFVLIIVGTILIIQGQRKIPLQYARRVVGRQETQGGNAYIPLKINYAGVIPVIFATSLLMFPATIGQFLGRGTWIGQFASLISPGTWVYMVFYVLLILFFTYFWTATQFHPEQIASDMKKNGAFIPGIRQGKPTQDYLESTMNRITFAGAVFLAMIAILPTIVGKMLSVDSSITYFFGGTSLLILVGVVLDTTKQIESHLLMKRYEGFMKKGRLRGR